MLDGAVGWQAELWDWRRRIAAAYTAVRAADDPRQGWEVWRETRDALFRNHPQSPLEPAMRAAFPGLSYHAYDPAWRLLVSLDAVTGAAMSLAAGGDGEVHLQPFARTRGLTRRLGRELTLFWIGGYGGGAFLPFRDTTNGADSYGGGRYLLDTIKGADLGTAPDGRTVLDFNFAYNPSCSYSARYVCPLSPAENRMTVAIEAGERH